MDKNTLTGVMLMAAIFFGFMYCNQPKPGETPDPAAEQAAAAKEDSLRRAQELIAPEITDANLAALRAALKAYGKDGAVSTEAYDLRLVNDSVIEGTVMVGSTAIDINDVLAGTYAESDALKHARSTRSLLAAAADIAGQGGFATLRTGADTIVGISNGQLALQLSSKGGEISSATLLGKECLNYLDPADTTQTVLWDNIASPGNNSLTFTLKGDGRTFSTADYYFTPVLESDRSVLMKLNFGGDSWWGIRYTLPEEGYYVSMKVVQHNMAAVDAVSPTETTMPIQWTQRMARLERGEVMEQRNSALYYKEAGDDVEDLHPQGHDGKTVNVPVKWVAFKNQFFSSILIADENFAKDAKFTSDELAGTTDFIKEMAATNLRVDYNIHSDEVAGFTLYLGPNLYPVLRDMDKALDEKHLDLTRVIPLGWPIFRWINTGIIIPVFTFLSKYILNYGIIILILTILIKIVLFPFTYKTYRSQAKMRLLAPQIKEINEKYPGNENAAARSQKTMALYSKAGVNPMGGCLPMLLQMPILVAMFSFFPSCIELRGQSFLWAQDLAAPDAIISWDANIPVISWLFDNHISLFCLLMSITNVIYSKTISASQAGGQTMPGMKLMTYGMPIMFFFWFNNYASGLSYYYFLSLLFTILQTYAIRHWVIDDAKVLKEMEENSKKPRKKNGWLAKMEEAQRKQQAAMREQAKRRK